MTEWKPHRYGSGATLDFGNSMRLTVEYEATERLPYGDPHFTVSVFGRILKARSYDMEDGKRRALAVARDEIAKVAAGIKEALDALNSEVRVS